MEMQNWDKFNDLIARVISGNALPEEQAELENAMLRSEALAQKYEQTLRVWNASQEQYVKVDTTADHVAVKDNIIRELNRKLIKVRTLWQRASVAAAIMIPLTVGGIWLMQNNNSESPISATFSVTAGKGQIAQCQLADGTKVTLNQNSQLSYSSDFTANNRNVQLDGEAYFEVTKDSLHPFSVKTAHGKIKVLGTTFNLRDYSSQKEMTATLEEGIVEFTAQNNKGSNSLRMKPGEQVVYLPEKNNIQVLKVDPSMKTAWRFGKYIFKDETLEMISREIEKIYQVQIDFSDNSLRSLRFRGIIEHQHTLFDAMENLEKTAGISYKVDGRKITIVKKKKTQTKIR